MDRNPYRSPTSFPAQRNATGRRPHAKKRSAIGAILKGGAIGAGLGVLSSVLAAIIAVWISWEHMSPGSRPDASPLLAVALFAVVMSVVTVPLGAIAGAFGFGVIPLVRRIMQTDSSDKTKSSRSPGE